MSEYEILLNDLYAQQAQLELERGYKLTKKDLLDFIDPLLKGDKNDKDYQKKIIDNLVSQVFVSDDDTVVYFNIRSGKAIETVSIEETKTAIEGLSGVQTQLPPSRQEKSYTNPRGCVRLFYFIDTAAKNLRVPSNFGERKRAACYIKRRHSAGYGLLLAFASPICYNLSTINGIWRNTNELD